MLVYSGGVMDQEGNAARVAGLGLGIPGDATDTADDTWRNIELLLRTSDFRTRCAAMRRRFEAYGDLQNIESALSYCFETTD